MQTKTQIRKALIGTKRTIIGRVYRAATDTWEEPKVLNSGYSGGLFEIFRIFYRWLKGQTNKIKSLAWKKNKSR